MAVSFQQNRVFKVIIHRGKDITPNHQIQVVVRVFVTPALMPQVCLLWSGLELRHVTLDEIRYLMRMRNQQLKYFRLFTA